jgi:hypothetical protein
METNRYPHADFGAVLHDETRGTSYPVNLMRNRAIDLVRTEYVLMLDGDFAPSHGLYEYVETYSERLAATGNFTALVLPCLVAVDGAPVPGNIDDVRKGLRDATVFPCGMEPDKPETPHAHVRFTDYESWLTATEWSVRPYAYPWEPYMIFKPACAPRFDETFIYYGDDKVQHAMHMSYHRFWYYVVPFHFVVHVPHDPGTWATWTHDGRGERAANFGKVKELLNTFMAKHKAHPEPPKCERPHGSLDPPGEPLDGRNGDKFASAVREAAVAAARRAGRHARRAAGGAARNGGRAGSSRSPVLLPWDALSAGLMTFAVVMALWMTFALYGLAFAPDDKPDTVRL